MQLIRELRRRRVFRTAAIYIVSSWLVMQVADVLFPAIAIDESAIGFVFMAAALGFPAALIFGWFYDVGADGIRRTPPAGPAEADADHSLGRGDYFILTALSGVIIAILFSTIGSVVDTPVQQVQVERERNAGPPVVAVLPFTAASLEGESEFFAIGVHDDLLTQLSKLEAIRVISRTSVLEYRDITRNLREIGAELGADWILEGGVQVAGEQIRINAQLIDTHTDEHLWAETYNRSLSASNIFDVQQEIARSITTAMNTTLTEQDNQQLSTIPTENMAAYRAYRRAMTARGKTALTPEDRRELLKEAVELDPLFVRAWAELVGSYSLEGFSDEGEPVRLAEEALEQVKLIAPDSAELLIAQSYYFYYILKDYDEAHNLLNRAIARSPSDVTLLELRSWIERRQGEFATREETIRLMVKLDPRNANSRTALTRHLILMHQYDEVLEEVSKQESADPYTSWVAEFIKLKDDRNYLPLLEKIKSEAEGQEEALWGALWFLYIVNRQYSDAAELFERVEQAPERPKWTTSDWEESAILTYWLTGEQSKLQAMLPGARKHMESIMEEDGTFTRSWSYISLGLVAAAEGNSTEALRMYRGWEELVRDDWAGKMISRDRACAIPAMAGAAAIAVNCIRLGLTEPSYMMPFLDPYLPMYDSIRNEPEFVQLIEELESTSSGE